MGRDGLYFLFGEIWRMGARMQSFHCFICAVGSIHAVVAISHSVLLPTSPSPCIHVLIHL